MLSLRSEGIATALVLVVLAGVPAWMVRQDRKARAAPAGESVHVVDMTAVADGGIYTFEDIAGHNYWRHRPKVARPVVRVGEKVLFRLRSADVTHGFSIPELAVGPIFIEPGSVTEVRFTPTESGEYLIQCTFRCGGCHEEMFAILEIQGPNGEPPPENMRMQLPKRKKCPLDCL
jgi:heme/copper-type cytochrome/quinol oxidase subunit 2